MRGVIFTICIALLPLFAGAQSLLSQSDRHAEHIYIYKLDAQQMHSIFVEGDEVTQKYLTNFVQRYRFDAERPTLPRGNYVLVQAVDNRLVFDSYTQDDILYTFLTRENREFFISDKQGKTVANATVQQGKKRFKYNPTTETYTLKKTPKKSNLLEINNAGVYHYLEVGDYRPYYRTVNTRGRPVKVEKRNPSKTYTGYVLLSKPKYRPDDTVKMKSYITNLKGQPLKKDVELVLRGGYYRDVDSVLTTLSPYRAGAYEYQFPLSEGLDLRLDARYVIDLVDAKSRDTYVSGVLLYEDYELTRTAFTVRAEKEKYHKTEEVAIFLKATDENGMAEFDGEVKIVVSPKGVSKYQKNRVFIPNKIWEHSVKMDQAGEKKIVIPDSLLIADASMAYLVYCSYLSPDNEKKEASVYFTRSGSEYMLDLNMSANGLEVKELKNGESVASTAIITPYVRTGEVLNTLQVALPTTIIPAGNVSYYTVKTDNATEIYYIGSYGKEVVNYTFSRVGSVAELVVSNPLGYPFWYTVSAKGGVKVVDKGYTSDKSLNKKYKNGGDLIAKIEYLYSDNVLSSQQSVNDVKNTMSIEVNTPLAVYPGQKTKVEVEVKDGRGRPLKNADVTAFAYTSKFNTGVYNNYRRAAISDNYRGITPYISNVKLDKVEARMDWDRWKREMELEGIEYYKFLHTPPIYSYSEPAKDGLTQLAPYVVIDGDVQGSHIVWIDNVPHYFSGAQQMQVYTFKVSPGKHAVRVRTFDRMIYADSIMVVEGHKTIVAIDGSKSREQQQITVDVVKREKHQQAGELMEMEKRYLSRFIIAITPNFGYEALQKWNRLPRPAYLTTGEKIYYINPTKNSYRYHRNYRNYYSSDRLNNVDQSPILVGPFPYNVGATLHVGDSTSMVFNAEGGYEYTIAPDLLKMKSWDSNLFPSTIAEYKPTIDFAEQPLKPADIDSIYTAKRYNMLRTSLSEVSFWSDKKSKNKADRESRRKDCDLELSFGVLGDGKTDASPMLIQIYDEQDSLFYYFRGEQRHFKLPEGRHHLRLYMEDMSAYDDDVIIRTNGRNYVRIDTITPQVNEERALRMRKFIDNRFFTTVKEEHTSTYRVEKAEEVGEFSLLNAKLGVVTGTVLANYYDAKQLVGVTVSVKGTAQSVTTDVNGKFSIKYEKGATLQFSYMGYGGVETQMLEGYDYTIYMSEDYSQSYDYNFADDYSASLQYRSMDEDEEIGYDFRIAGKPMPIGSVSNTEDYVTMDMSLADESSAEKVSVAQGETPVVEGGIPPMIILNGLPYSGKLEDIDEQSIVSYKKMDLAQALKLYGEQGRGGVLIITTHNVEDMSDGQGMRLRNDFRDDAFWQPTITTNNAGRAEFEVAYPDDITSWLTHFYAMEGRKYIAFKQMMVRSFKALNAQLSVPRFAIEGDNLSAVGRLTNYMGDTVALRLKATVDGKTTEESISLATSRVDVIKALAGPAVAEGEEADSIKISYTIQKEDGFFDGEERLIPIYPQGVLETTGMFEVINNSDARTYEFDPELGDVTLHAEASSLELFMREIDKMDNYPYMCNEQIASKIKALVVKRRVCKIFELPFKEDKKIEKLLTDLAKNRNENSMWGWWNKSETTLWISKQVIEAVIMAEKEGFKSDLDRRKVTDYLVMNLNKPVVKGKHAESYKRDYNTTILLLKEVGASLEYPKFIERVESITDTLLYGKLLTMRAKQVSGVKISTKELMKLSEATMIGGLMWGEKPKFIPYLRNNPYINNVQATLLAYAILRDEGGHEKELGRIQNYFFETRKHGSWSNTYEAARIMETIMPDMLKVNEKYAEVSAEIGSKSINKFPYTTTVSPMEMVTVKKNGVLPLFFTAYQQSWNKQPEAVDKGFEVHTVFRESSDTVSVLTAGKSTELVVTIELKSDADYVMIEVPIPAGCTYDSKHQSWYGRESHREFYKDRVAMFSTSLTKGKHTFVINLLPRFTGTYHLNPTRAELMYFPTFYGREQMKVMDIE